MGTRALTSHGVEIGKIRILARRSGEAIYRYADGPPLVAVQGEIDRHASRTVIPGHEGLQRPATWRPPNQWAQVNWLQQRIKAQDAEPI